MRTETGPVHTPAPTRDRAYRDGFFTLPSSVLGRVSTLLFAAAAVLIALRATWIESLPDPPWAHVVVVAIAACVLATGVTGVVAVAAKRERSWAVLVPTALCVVVLGNEAVQLLRSL